ncbi:hypothetical protein F5887DRAFT_1075891 [Amanita rubescens]|nr:hypothetical protein F5887DRAFT_1075891 [Amanita rubescens]
MLVGPTVFNLLSFILLICITNAILVNISIDDRYGDHTTGQIPVYQPNNIWTHSPCDADVYCITSPNTTLAFDQTWSAAFYTPGHGPVFITFPFTGVSLWVFFILINNTTSSASIMSTTSCNFTLDGNDVGTFAHWVDYEATWTVQYNATVFSVSGLSNSLHEFIISTSSGQVGSYIIFDYAIYTADVPDNTTTSSTSGSLSTLSSILGSSPTGGTAADAHHVLSSNSKVKIAIGCAVGSLAFAALIAVLVLFRRSGKKWTGLTSLNQRSHGNHGAMSDARLPSENSIHNQSRGSGILTDLHSPIRSTLPDLANASATLVPVRRGDQPPHPKNRNEVRAFRQMEINRRLQSAQQEMLNLTSRQTVMGRGGPSSSFADGARGRGAEIQLEQIRQLRTEIEQLLLQLSSDWAQGLSDEPPPAYHLLS